MKAFLLAVGVLGLAAYVGRSEPAPACTAPITSGEVQLVSEDLPPGEPQSARFRNTGKGHRGGYLTR